MDGSTGRTRVAGVLAIVSMLGLVAGCAPPPAASGSGGVTIAGLSPEEEGLVYEGSAAFRDTCATCHGPDGAGVPHKAPPLRASPWVLGSDRRFVRIILDGVRDDDTEGRYLLPMAAWRILDDRRVAAIASFARRAWGHAAAPVSPATVAAVRAETTGRMGAWRRHELEAIP